MKLDTRLADQDDWQGQRGFSFHLVCAVIAVLFLAGCLMITSIRWQCRGIGIDTAVWGQLLHVHATAGVWEYTGYVDQVGTAARTIWGTHFNLTLWPLAALYALFPHVLMLYVLQHVAYVLGGWIVGALAYQLAQQDRWVGWLTMLAYLAYPPLVRPQIGFDYSSRHLVMLLLPLAGWLFRRERHLAAVAALAVLSAGIENLGLLAGFFCYVLAWESSERRTLYLVTGTFFVLYPFMVIMFGLPHWRLPDAPSHSSLRYAHLTLTDLPGTIVRLLWSRETLGYLVALLAPLAFLPLIFPSRWLLATIPFLAQNLLSTWPETRLIGHHYTSPLAVAFFLAVLPAFVHAQRRRIALSLLVCCLVIGHLTSPVLDQISTLLFAEVSEMNSLYAPIESRIPPDASVSAPHHLAARLCSRRRLWFFPQGADEADFVIIPHMPLSFPAVTVAEAQQCQARLMQSGRYEQMGDQEFFTVLRRRPTPPDAGAANMKGTP